VAALTGHAIAGGCILALCCDFRIIAEGKKLMGLNEIKLGVPIPYPGDRILTYLVGHRISNEIQVLGEFYPAEELLELGMVDQVYPVKDVVPESISRIEQISSTSLEAFRVIKQNRVERVENEIRAGLEEKHQSFMDCWFADDTRLRLKEAMEKF
jgi:enoyl-CoA hydratase/carnithine racemase